MPFSVTVVRVAAAVLFSTFTAIGLPGSALSAGAEGGGGACPWLQDNRITLGAQTLDLPQTVFKAKTIPVNVQGFDIFPDIDKLKVVIVDPYSDMWEASLTRLLAGKRCISYYVGEPVLVSSGLIQNAEAPPAKKQH